MKTHEEIFINAYKKLKKFKKTFNICASDFEKEVWYAKQEQLRKKKNKLFKKL